MLWLGVHYPQWALQYFYYRNELAANTAVLLFEPNSLQVLAFDQQSQQAGVVAGMSLSTAQSLIPVAMLVEFDLSMRQQASDWLCQWSYEFSARVVPLRCSLSERADKTAVKSKLDVDEFVTDTLLLEISSMELIFEGTDKLIEQYRQRAQALGLTVYLAVAKTPLAAQLLAKHHATAAINSLSAHASSKVDDYLELENSPLLLNKLPVALLPLSDFLLQSLQGFGISSFASLQALPDKELGRRFGTNLLQLMAKILGKLPQPLRYFEPEDSYQQKLTLLHEVESMQGIIFPLGRMLKEMASYLQQRQLAVQQLKLSLVYRSSDLSQLDIIIHYPFAEHRSDSLLSLCRMQLERSTLYQPVVEMIIDADKFVPITLVDESWFGQERPLQGQTSEKTQRLLALLQARLGREKVKGLQATSAHQAEEGWLASDLSASTDNCSLGHLSRAQADLFSEPSSLCVGACRPSWLLNTPELISAASIDILKGPERLETLWWQEPQRCRDYYIASHHLGGLCWVFKEQDKVFLHGWFG